jgi:death-on-curing protein
MGEPKWLERRLVDYIHYKQVVLFGGSHGVRDSGLIDSALARSQHKWLFGEVRDLFTLAAAYGYGLALNHGYLDGNKRVAFVAMTTFLELNGYEFDASQADVIRFMLALASGERIEEDVADWLRVWSRPLEK